VSAFALCHVLCMAAGARAQDASAPEPARQATQEPAPTSDTVAPSPMDVAGYLAARIITSDDLVNRDVFREYSGSMFVSKTIRRWRFHSEVNATTAPEWDSEGIHLFPRASHLSVKLETASVNFNWRDGLQLQAGFLFVPTYWRTHRHQSATLTVDEPLIDQAVFPTAFTGAMILGNKYRDEGGISYQLYGGSSQQATFANAAVLTALDRSGAIGGKVVWHIPSRRAFNTLDIGFLAHHGVDLESGSKQMYGAELNLEMGPLHVLGEFADSSNGPSPGQTAYTRQGYYLEPSYRIAPPLFVVARYERLNRDSRDADVNRLARQSLGVTYRPIPDLSVKFEANRLEPRRGRLLPYYGVGASVVYFFRVP
jgi:hypothetical protein